MKKTILFSILTSAILFTGCNQKKSNENTSSVDSKAVYNSNDKSSKNKLDTYTVMKITAYNINKSLPIRLDEMTILTDVSAEKNPLTLVYNQKLNGLTLPNGVVVNYKLITSTNKFKDGLSKMLINKFCNDSDLLTLMNKNNIIIKSRYVWEDDRKLFTVTVDKKECQKLK